MGLLDRFFGNDRDRFANTIIRHFRKNGWTGPIAYQPQDFALAFDEGQRLFLQNSYDDWRKAEDKPALLDHLLNMIHEMRDQQVDMEDFSAVSPLLIASLRHRGFIENLWMQEGLGENAATYQKSARPFCEHMCEVLIVDSAYSIAMVNDQSLGGWGHSFEDVRPLALQNLRAQKPVRFSRDQSGFWFSNSEDYLDSSLPLMPDAFAQLELKGNPLAVVVSRSLVMVAGSQDAVPLHQMANTALEMFLGETRPIACAPIMLVDGQWHPVTEFTGPLEPLKRLQTEQILFDYRDQHFILTSYFERTGRDVFVADILTFQSEGSDEKTLIASLTWNVVAVMPKVDAFIVQGPQEGQMVLRSWAQVMEVCGEKPTEPHTYPARYLFAEGVTEAQWERLRDDYPHPEAFNHIKLQG